MQARHLYRNADHSVVLYNQTLGITQVSLDSEMDHTVEYSLPCNTNYVTLGKLSKQLGLLSEYKDVNLTGMLEGLSEINVKCSA